MRLRFHLAMPLLATMLVSACGGGSSQPAASTDPAPINDLRNRYVAAYNAGDAAALALLFTEDAVSLPDHRPALVGRAAIQRDFEQMFAQFAATLSVTPSDTAITGDMGHEHGTYSVTLTPKAGGDAVTNSGKYLVVFERQADGSWLLHHDMDNSDSEHSAP